MYVFVYVLIELPWDRARWGVHVRLSQWYKQTELTVGRVKDPKKTKPPARLKRFKGTRRLGAGSQPSKVGRGMYLEMEIIVSTRGNEIFPRWLDHIREEIQSKPYDGPFKAAKHWRIAKMRYVYATTGPRSMKKFFNKRSNREIAGRMSFIELNHFKDAAKLTTNDRRCFDVISHESNSYFTTEHEIKVPLGLGLTPLPAIPVSKRMRHKCARRQYCLIPDTDVPVLRSQPVASDETHNHIFQDAHAPPATSSKKHTHSGNESASSVPQTAESKSAEVKSAEGKSDDEDQAYKMRAEHHLRVSQLRHFFKTRGNSVPSMIVMDQMPDELASWIKAGQHDSNEVPGDVTPEFLGKPPLKYGPEYMYTPPRRNA